MPLTHYEKPTRVIKNGGAVRLKRLRVCMSKNINDIVADIQINAIYANNEEPATTNARNQATAQIEQAVMGAKPKDKKVDMGLVSYDRRKGYNDGTEAYENNLKKLFKEG